LRKYINLLAVLRFFSIIAPTENIDMKSFKELSTNFKPNISECTGVDIGTTVTKVVRLKRLSNNSIVITAADLIKPDSSGSISIPAPLRARYASIATSGSNSVIKLLNVPGAINASFEKSLPQKLGINADDDFRVSYTVVSEGAGRSDSLVLAVALPEEEAEDAMSHFTTGFPAPYSLEISALATLNAFEHGPVAKSDTDAIGLIDFGANTTSMAVFYRKKLAMIRFFKFGTKMVMEHLKSVLKINSDTARGILDDASFDVSDLLTGLMNSIAGELTVSRDFVERDKNCSLDLLYAVGGISISQAAMQSLAKTMNSKIIPWDPFDDFDAENQEFSDDVNSQHWRFAGAIGAALATLEES
jgi:Tfp pilus assembly PilM family ATPase